MRARNLRTLYGDEDDDIVGGDKRSAAAIDKSPKGSVDERIRPLGRGGKWIFVTHDVLSDLKERVIDSLVRVGRERYSNASSASPPITPRVTTRSIRSPPRRRRLRMPVTFKHEPPLLHVAARTLESGRRLLRICKGDCAMRESGLVVTNSRVTVEVRTNSTSLCLPVWVDVGVDDKSRHRRIDAENDDDDDDDDDVVDDDDDDDDERIVVTLSPDENYLRMVSDTANERMMRNGDMIDRLFRNVKENDGGGGESVIDYRMTIRHALPPLNLWKTAAVVVRSVGSRRARNDQIDVDDADRGGHDIDVDLLAFGGQGVGPALLSSSVARADRIDVDDVQMTTSTNGTSMSYCRRHDDVYRLKRRGGAWSDRWETLSRIAIPSTIAEGDSNADVSFLEANAGSSIALDDGIVVVNSSAGKIRVRVATEGMGRREGHVAVVVPPTSSPRRIYANKEDEEWSEADAVIVFGGRTTTTTTNGEGGVRRSLMPSNEMFLFVLLPNLSPLLSDAAMLSSENKHMEDAKGRLWSREEDAVGFFGIPLDVRGTPPEPRFGHTMTVLSENNEQRHGRPFAVVAGGTGIDCSLRTPRDNIDAYQPSICLASIYTLSCIAPYGGGDGGGSKFSHFVWDRVADMPDPRSYHASVTLGGSYGDHDLFVFGGYNDANDPFTSPCASSSSSSWFKTPLRIGGGVSVDLADNTAPDHTNAMSNIAIDDEMLLPARVGSSAVSLALTSTITLLLVIGGASAFAPASSSSCGLEESDDGKVPPLVLLALQKRHQHPKLTRIQSPELEVVNVCDSISGGGDYDGVDFGACVHHCVIALPRRRDDGASTEAVPQTADDDYPTIIIVGGGVPSLSFGQSYARSYIIDVSRTARGNFVRTKSLKHHKFPVERSTMPKSDISARQPTAAATTAQADVIYVNAHNAKKAKNVLESLGLLNKRYKMVKVNYDYRDDNLIAIPVTERFTDQLLADNVRGVNCASRLKQFIVKRGIETVPLSSSSMGRMKQKR
ncbi:hypothetical protein ACHAXA_010610 [Cyclostephanos tholiformis]|uniref:tRNA(Phe) 7-[(3-amino-3-carboxypropyl)-4-demethylwyosine(37)-N(4)]-methyltransferase n=1 Tax=Cyclostephanos tholiformis TaxID=382380 RepID=A0ABD3R9G2_9STRA